MVLPKRSRSNAGLRRTIGTAVSKARGLISRSSQKSRSRSQLQGQRWKDLLRDPLVIQARAGDISTVGKLVASVNDFIGRRMYAAGHAELERVAAVYARTTLPVKKEIKRLLGGMAQTVVEDPAELERMPQIARNFMIQLARESKV